MKEFIEWEELDLKKQSGMERLLCPKCNHKRSNKRDRSLSINHTLGCGKCHYCEALTFRESELSNTKIAKEYKLPSQDWRNYTTLSDSLVKHIEDTRKISQSTLNHFGITEEEYYQPMAQKKVNNLVFNYFEGKTLVNKKYRDGAKRFTQSTGTRSIFYNINAVIDQEEVWIVEGEFDVLAMHEVGIKNVISVPNGANDNDEPWLLCKDKLSGVEKWIIATDNDTKGIELRDKIAQRLGRYKCRYVVWENKDANDDLIAGVLEESVKNIQYFKVGGTFKTSDLINQVYDLYDNGLPKTLKPTSYCFNNLNRVFSIMHGQLTVATGIPSHGKSNFTDWYVLNLIKDHDLKASWYSPEHTPMSLYHTNLMEKVVGKNFWKEVNGVPRITKEEIEQYKEWSNEKIYLTASGKGEVPDWDWLLERFNEQMFIYGINIFVIDAFNKVILPSGKKLDAINEILTKLTHFAQSNNVSIILVAHPTKMRKKEDGTYEKPTLYDVSGSSDFRNQTHNGYTIYRHWANELEEARTTFTNTKTKFNFQGSIGEEIDFDYCLVNGRFYEKGSKEPLYNLITNEEVEKEADKPLPTITPTLAFDEDINNDDPF